MKAKTILAVCCAGLMTGGCSSDELADGVDVRAIEGNNRVALNRVALNRVALNRVALNRVALNRVALNRVALNRVALNQVALEQVDLAGADVLVIDAPLAEAEDIVDKWVRCWQPEGTSVEIDSEGDIWHAQGMFGINRLAELGVGTTDLMACMGACLAVHANDRIASVNFTGQIGPYYIAATHAEAQEYNVPGVMTTYRVDAVDGDGLPTQGTYLFNTARIDLSPQARGWLKGGGLTPPVLSAAELRVCREAALARAPMPEVCGGTESTVLEGAQRPQQQHAAWPPPKLLCQDSLYDAAPDAEAAIDMSKGTSCHAVGADHQSASFQGQPFTCTFHADLRQGGPTAEDVVWDQVLTGLGAGDGDDDES